MISTRIVFMHFMPNLTNTEKQNLISNAALDLVSGNPTSIPDYVKLQSRIISGWHWVYPCLPEAITKKNTDSLKHAPNIVPLPCEGCPDCTPRYEYYEYNNIDNAIQSLSANSSIRSVSKGFTYSSSISSTTGTEENFYIKIKPNYTINDFSTYLTTYGFAAQDVSINYGTNVYKITVPRERTPNLIGWANLFFNTNMCEYSAPNFLQIGKTGDTNDPRWMEQWGLLNTGQYNGISGSDIRAVNAWQFTKGNGIKIAIIDEGVYINNPDLAGNMLPGFDAVPNSTSILGWHGTLVAGVAAAIADNNIDISGVAPEAKIIPVKVFSPDDNAANIGLVDQIVRGINWAVESGADVINCSWGVDYESDMIDIAIDDAALNGRNSKGSIVVFSSGNVNNSKQRFPSSTHLKVITTGAMTHCNSRKSPTSCDPNAGYAAPEFLDWGSNYNTNLSIMAPGVRIPTVNIDPTTYNLMNITGTSGSAPMVSGVAALVLSINPNLTYTEVRKILELSSNKVGNYCYNWTPDHPNGSWNIEMGYGRLNAYNAVQLARPGVTISSPTYNVAAQTSNIITGNIGVNFSGAACPTSLPFGLFFVRRHEVLKNISYPFTPNPVIICSSNGFTQANPNDGRRWAEAINITNTSATLRAYVYYGYNSIGQQLGWIPMAPGDIQFSYVVVGSPVNIDYQLVQNRGMTLNSDKLKNIPFKLEFDENFIANDIPYEIVKNKIYPNPVSKMLSINIDSENARIENLEIVNSFGIRVKVLLPRKLAKGMNTIFIDVADLVQGMYILKIGTESYKFIKQ